MTVTVPTAADFKARHLRFASLSDDAVTAYLTEASASVSDCWPVADQTAACMYLAAHLMVMEGALAPTRAAPGVGNQIKRVKAGSVETEFSTDTIPAGVSGQLWATYGATTYGRSFVMIASRNGQGEAVILVV